MNEKNRKAKIFSYIPLWCMILLLPAGAALCVETISRHNVRLADTINDTSGRAIRFFLTNLTNFIPFSLAETVIICSPLILMLLILLLVRAGKRGARHLIRTTASVLALASVFYSAFVFGYGTGYYGTTIDKKLGMTRADLTPEELYETASRLLAGASREVENVTYPEYSYSALPYSYSELNDKLNDAWETVCDKYPGFQKLYSRTKPVMLSEPWTYTHISGLYSFPSGEANVNVNYPDFIVVTSAAHEMAHQRGICLEAEANFASFLVCINSDDPYIRYSGYLDMYREVRDKLYDADVSLYRELVSKVPDEIRAELNDFAVSFVKYTKSKAAVVTDKINGTYLEFHGQESGTKSYGLVVDLLCSYMLYGEGAES